MNELKLFNNPEFGSVRAMEIDGEAWLVGKDVAEILGYTNTRDALAKHVDEEDKATVAIHDGSQNRNVTAINESGLYSLILSSKLPSAKKFKHWVTSDVLPSIRKHGVYMTDETLAQALQDPDNLIKILTNLKELKAKKNELENQIQNDRPKVLFADAVQTSKSTILVGDLAKLLRQNGVKIGQNRLFEWMRNSGYLIKSGSSKNMPTQRALNMGLFSIKESTVVNPDGAVRVTKTTKVTGKGQQYFINKFLGGQEDAEYTCYG
jgi:anti-repressor protein